MNKKTLTRIALEQDAEKEVRKWNTDDGRKARIRRITRRVKSGGGLTVIRRSA